MDQEQLLDLGLSPEDIAQADEQVSMVEFGTVHTSESKQIWFYLKISPSRYPDYKRAFSEGDAIDIKSYGEVLACGWGDTPPSDVVQHMKETFGCDHGFENELKQAIETELQNINLKE